MVPALTVAERDSLFYRVKYLLGEHCLVFADCFFCVSLVCNKTFVVLFKIRVCICLHCTGYELT
jgi:hypothetical protein